MPGIHLDVWGTTWLCEKAREGSRLPPEVRLVCKLASKAKPALQNSSVPFGLAQKHLLFDCLSEVVRPGFGQPRPPWFPSRSQLSCSRIRRQKGHMRAAIVDACGQQAVEKLQEAAEQQPGDSPPRVHQMALSAPPPPAAAPVSPVRQVALQQVACLEVSLRAELGRRYLLKEEKSSKTCDSSIRQQRAPSTREEISFQEPWLLTVRLSSSAVLVRQNLSVVL
ncbi:hypothetical protein DUI87_33952 [Hirundo rustica rustica]|uniref:Uncharacterized protein n=1 Tax=Hirundo rustica rustica TaxID=333673 RepID=A0A3M0IMI9_HIRRU|nr:hypothetical protein DUI87_33952 [Hirundo rustica rustica]